jgi:hypothetical protein
MAYKPRMTRRRRRRRSIRRRRRRSPFNVNEKIRFFIGLRSIV